MDKLRQIKMIWKIMWWRRFNDLRQTKIEVRQINKQLKTIKLYEYINKNKNIYSKAKRLNDDLLKNDIVKLEDEVQIIRNMKTKL